MLYGKTAISVGLSFQNSQFNNHEIYICTLLSISVPWAINSSHFVSS